MSRLRMLAWLGWAGVVSAGFAVAMTCLVWPTGRAWLNVHIWAPMWPNIFAPSACSLAAIAVSHVRLKVHQNRLHEQVKEHVTKEISGA